MKGWRKSMKRKVRSLSLGMLMMSLTLMAPKPAATQTPECTVIGFDELAHAALIGNFYASRGVRFETFESGNGIAWDVLSAGYAVQNPPSGSQVAHLSFGGQPPCGLQADAAPGADILFDSPVQSVRFKYAACNDVSIEAFDQNDVSLGKSMGNKTGNGQPYSDWRSLRIEMSDRVIHRITVRGIAVIDDLELCGLPGPACPPVAIQNNFNDQAIRAGRFIWFNSAFRVNGLGPTPTTIGFDGATIQFRANGAKYDLKVPNTRITFSPTATPATTTFDTATQTWITIVPLNLDGNVFLSGLAFPVSTDLPNFIRLVSWKGSFTTDTPGVTIQWKWAAAVYTNFSSDPNELGVKPVDDSRASQYPNADNAGTPENFAGYVTGGALGRGFTNYTGSYRGSNRTTPCVVE